MKNMLSMLIACLATSVYAFSRFNIGNDASGNPLTCAGAAMSEQIKKTVRGENLEVPVSIIARYPFVETFVKNMSDFHTICAVVLMILIFVQMFRPYGSSPNKAEAKAHVIIGKIVSYGIAPHYVLIGCVLNYYAIMLPLEDWKLAPPASEWRLHIAYIIPFALNILVSMVQGFYLMRKPMFSSKTMAMVMKYISLCSCMFWLVFGNYMCGAQALGYLGAFGLGIEKVVPGAPSDQKTADMIQGFFQPINVIVLMVGNCQAGQDYINYKCGEHVQRAGLNDLSWKDMHKWSMINLSYQAGVIFGLFVGFFPYCVVFEEYGFPEWTCVQHPVFTAPFIMLFLLPIMQHIGWTMKFIPAVCGDAAKIRAFSKNTHKWDVPQVGSLAGTVAETLTKPLLEAEKKAMKQRRSTSPGAKGSKKAS